MGEVPVTALASREENKEPDMDPIRRNDDPQNAMLYSHERRISRLEGDFQDMARCMNDMKHEQHRQTEITTRIARDTEDIRSMVAGAKAVGKFASWIGGITAALVSIYAVLGILQGM